MREKVKVSIIIPSYNRAGQLRRCLESLSSFCFEDKEIIVVDDGSADETSAMIREDFPEVILIRHESSFGPSASRNEAVKAAKGEYLWFLDSDSIVENKDCLSNMIEVIEGGFNIGCVGGEYVYTQDRKKALRKNIICSNGETVTSYFKHKDSRMENCDYIATNNCFMRKNFFESIGGFDPLYFILSEDCELGYKVKRRGFKNVVDMKTSVFHDIVLSNRRSDLFRVIKNRLRFVFKNFNLIQIIFLPLNEVKYVLESKQVKNLINNDFKVLKHLSPGIRNLFFKGGINRVFGLFCVGITYISCLFAAYAWNIALLPRTLHSRFKKSHLS